MEERERVRKRRIWNGKLLKYHGLKRATQKNLARKWQFSRWSLIKRNQPTSLRTQTYFRLSLVSAENNFYEPEPGNDFCDVGILSQSQFSSNSPRTTARGIRCEEHSSFILSWNLIGEGETKVITSQKSFLGSGSQTLFSAETCDSRKYVCVRRLPANLGEKKRSVCLEISNFLKNKFVPRFESNFKQQSQDCKRDPYVLKFSQIINRLSSFLFKDGCALRTISTKLSTRYYWRGRERDA